MTTSNCFDVRVDHAAVRGSGQSMRNLIPRIERLPQGEVRFDSFLDLVKRETEFT
jgi:hypothetical protein